MPAVLILTTFVALQTAGQDAAERLPSPDLLVGESGTNGVQFDCSPVWDEEQGKFRQDLVDCTMYSVFLGMKTDPSEVETELTKLRADFERRPKGERQKMYSEICSSLASAKPETMERDPELAELLQKACAKKSPDAMLEIGEGLLRKSARTCVVKTMLPSVQRFKRTGRHRWVWNEGPKGLCNATTIGVLSSENGFQWEYTQTRLDADRDTETCRALELHKPTTWTWKKTATKLKCETLGFD
jgi:hypothetical protein